MSTDSPRVSVVMPTAHEATRRIAKVLADEGVLGEFLVAFDSWKLDGWLARFGGIAQPLRGRLGQWRFEPRGHSGAVCHELACAAAFRFLSSRPGSLDPSSLLAGRRRAMSRAVKSVVAHSPDAILFLQSFHRGGFRRARAAGVDTWIFAMWDVWELHDQLSRLAAAAPPGPWRSELLAEAAEGAFRRISADLRLARVVITESPRMTRRVAPFLRSDAEVVELGQGVDCQGFVPCPRDYEPRRLRVVQVARCTHGKGLTAANSAVGLATEAVASYRVIGWESERKRILAQSVPNLTLIGGGPRQRVVEELDRADVMVLPTLGDSMPRAVLEAMACGLPVITTYESGYDHLIRHGENGFLVPAHDPEAIAVLLKTLADDGELRARVGRAARATAEENTWEHLEERFRRAFRERLLPMITSKAVADADEPPPA